MFLKMGGGKKLFFGLFLENGKLQKSFFWFVFGKWEIIENVFLPWFVFYKLELTN
jgi:hypothetical protein